MENIPLWAWLCGYGVLMVLANRAGTMLGAWLKRDRASTSTEGEPMADGVARQVTADGAFMDWSRPIVTANGRKATHLGVVERGGDYPRVVNVEGENVLRFYMENGRLSSIAPGSLDLFNVVEEPAPAPSPGERPAIDRESREALQVVRTVKNFLGDRKDVVLKVIADRVTHCGLFFEPIPEPTVTTAEPVRAAEAFDPSKPVQYRGGTPARILCTDAPGTHPIIAIATECDDDVEPTSHKRDGRYWMDGGRSDMDLVNVPPPKPRTHVAWVKVWGDGIAVARRTKEAIDAFRGDGPCVACARVVIEEGRYDDDAPADPTRAGEASRAT
jgi:hypothetical protein